MYAQAALSARGESQTHVVFSSLIILCLIFAGCGKTTPDYELLKNGYFSSWAQADKSPDNWNFGGDGQGAVAKEAAVIRVGSAISARITHNSGNFVALYQDIAELEKYKGKEYAFGAWVNTKSPSSAKLVLYDNASGVHSAATHTGTGRWEYLEIKGRIDEKATSLRLHVFVENKATAYVYQASFKVSR